MTKPPQPAPFRLELGKGAAVIHSLVQAELCTDQGVCISCVKCGHIYVKSKPLSDQSWPVDNLALARQLWFHDCSREGQVHRRADETRH